MISARRWTNWPPRAVDRRTRSLLEHAKAIDDNKPGICGLKFCNDAPCTGNPFGCRCKDFVQGRDLLWMDGPLAGKAQITRLFGGNTHAIHVIKIKERYVDDIQPGTGGGADHA